MGVHYGLLCVVLHNVQVRLLEVPRVNVDIKVVDPWDVAEEFPVEHVKVAIKIDENCVKNQRLVGLQAVKGFATANGEGSVLDFAGVS